MLEPEGRWEEARAALATTTAKASDRRRPIALDGEYLITLGTKGGSRYGSIRPLRIA